MKNLSIKVVGLGEGGAKAVNKMLAAGVGKDKSVEFLTVGNDENIMLTSTTRKNLFLNRDLTTIYKSFADALNGARLIFIVGGLGGNAARSAVPVITSCAKKIGAVTVALVCRPFVLENVFRKTNAEQTFNDLRGKVDTLIVLPAEKFFLFRMKQPQVSIAELFDVADNIFCQGVKIFLDMLDDKDKNLMLFRWGNAAFGYGEATNVLDAVKNAVAFPTFEENALKNAEVVFMYTMGGKKLASDSQDVMNNFVKDKLKPDVEFFSQTKTSPALGDKIFAAIVLTRKEGNLFGNTDRHGKNLPLRRNSQG